MRSHTSKQYGQSANSDQEIKKVFLADKKSLVMAAIFSALVNLLFLTGPLFMLQVYDRVIASGSYPTLVVLFGLVCGLFLFMGALDHLRGRVLARIGCWLQASLGQRVFSALLKSTARPELAVQRATALNNLQTLRRFLGTPLPFAFVDAPWSLVFFTILFFMHWMFGALALAGGAVLLILALFNQRQTGKNQDQSQRSNVDVNSLQQSILAEQEVIKGLGMREHMLDRWRQGSVAVLDNEMAVADRSGGYSVSIKTLRLWLQSAMLALGAYLVLQLEATPGVMITSSIIMGRALMPLEQLVNQWSSVVNASQAYRSLNRLLTLIPADEQKLRLPAPQGRLVVRNTAVRFKAVGAPNIHDVSFNLEPGEALGVLGKTGSGKSTLSKAIAGVWPLVSGEIRYDGALASQWLDDELGQFVGYLPQNVALFDGTIAENIARMQSEFNDDDVVAAAKKASVHDMILGFPDGYNTRIGPRGEQLSGGQGQLIALARSFFGNPRFVILDEPNAHLDSDGEKIVTQAIEAIKASGACVVVTAHRPSIVPVCDKLLVMDQGRQVAFGPRDEVLQKTVQNIRQVPASQQANHAMAADNRA